MLRWRVLNASYHAQVCNAAWHVELVGEHQGQRSTEGVVLRAGRGWRLRINLVDGLDHMKISD